MGRLPFASAVVEAEDISLSSISNQQALSPGKKVCQQHAEKKLAPVPQNILEGPYDSR
jgi:hypothetical protein